MLIIRNEQLQAFRAAATLAFIESMVAFLGARDAVRFGPDQAARTRRLLVSAIERGALGFTSQHDCKLFTLLLLRHGATVGDEPLPTQLVALLNQSGVSAQDRLAQASKWQRRRSKSTLGAM